MVKKRVTQRGENWGEEKMGKKEKKRGKKKTWVLRDEVNIYIFFVLFPLQGEARRKKVGKKEGK